MRLEFEHDTLGTANEGLEIGIKGFRIIPTDAEDAPTQIYIEVYEGRLRVHVWDGSSQDPTSIVAIAAPALTNAQQHGTDGARALGLDPNGTAA